MKRKTQQWIGLTAAGLVFVSGCAAGPQTRPTPRTPGTAAGSAGSTTGDMDACAVALGNMVAGPAGAKGTLLRPRAPIPVRARSA